MKTIEKNSNAENFDEEIEKAFEKLSDEAEIIKDEDTLNEEDLEKAEDEDTDTEEETEEEDNDSDDNDDEIEKAAKKMDDDEDDDENEEDYDEGDENIKKGKKKKNGKTMNYKDDDYKNKMMKKKMKKGVDDDLNGERNEEVQKGVEVSPFLKGIVNDIEKANRKTRLVLSNVATLISNLTERMDDLEKAESNKFRPSKSRINRKQIVDKFEKSLSDGIEDEETTVLGMRKNYNQIINLLDVKSFGEDGKTFNEVFAKAMTGYETTKTLPAHIVAKLQKEDNVIIDPRS